MTGIKEESLWCQYDSCQSHKTFKVFYGKGQFHRRSSQQKDLPIAIEISKCFSLKYKLALSIWNWKNLGWKIFSSSKLRSKLFAIFSYCRQLCVCMFLYGNLLLLLAQGWLVHFCHWDMDIKAGEQKWASVFFVSSPTVCAQAAAQGSVSGPTCRLTSPTPLALVQRFPHLADESLEKEPSLCLVLTRPCSCSAELSPEAAAPGLPEPPGWGLPHPLPMAWTVFKVLDVPQWGFSSFKTFKLGFNAFTDDPDNL